jgi:hypothetical protein
VLVGHQSVIMRDGTKQRTHMNKAQKHAALDMLEGALRSTTAAQENREKYLRHHCGWLVSAVVMVD